ncbi:unnamed protein product [Cylicocyclus nassatus]|uniref:Peptidase A1 domain-containing protein n=1 Tax=Cylicocyclus nassatus TaxID=53992 RepID=A0AA36DM55_CYLNA|nr:unnamed protein product [Cylicocyclus nassatus]
MKRLLLLAILVALLQAKSFKMRTRSSGSLRAKMISTGQYRQYLQKQRMRRLNILKRGSEPFLDYADDFYLGEVQVGTPGQNLTLVLDTGSSNLWVIDDACRSAACNGSYHHGEYHKHKFNTSRSETFKREERTFVMEYGSGYCKGYLATDVVAFADLTIRKQEFGVATVIADVFGYQPVDGILGLGWPDLAVEKVVPPMQNILSELDKPIFTVWLDRKIIPSQGGNGGMITYGDYDSDDCAAEVNYVPLSSLTYWQFPIQGFSVGNFSQRKTEQVISDTGTSWVGAPYRIVEGLAKEIKAQYDPETEIYTVPCSTMQTQPDLVFTINDIEYTVPSVEYILDLELGHNKKMRLTLLLVALVLLIEARSFTMRVRSSGSLRTEKTLNGQYQEHLGKQQLRNSNVLRNYNDEFFVGTIEVGFPGQEVKVLLDTSSANLWVIDDACISDACNESYHGCSKHKFKTSESKTFRKEDRSFVMSTCEGYLAKDVVSFAGNITMLFFIKSVSS